MVAEWAMVERLSAEGKLTSVYTAHMREQAKEQLASAQQQIGDRNAPEAKLIATFAQADRPDAATLTRAAAALDQMEKQLEDQ